jgi:hypothetical protein
MPAVDLHTLVDKVVAIINTIIFLSLRLPYFSTRRGCRRVVKFYRGFLLTKKIGFQPKKKFGDPPRGRFLGFFGGGRI